VRGFGFGVQDTVIQALGCTGCYAYFFRPSVESLPAYSIHLGDRLADPCQYCRSPIRQLQPGQCSTVSRKFRRAGSGITAKITRLPPSDFEFRKRPTGNSGAFFCYPTSWILRDGISLRCACPDHDCKPRFGHQTRIQQKSTASPSSDSTSHYRQGRCCALPW
jgi:hypothetical protein